MRIKNAFRILLSNIGTIYKIVLYRFIGMVIFALVAYFAVLSELKPLFEQPETAALREAIDALLKGFLSGHGVNTETLRPAFDAFCHILAQNVLRAQNPGSIHKNHLAVFLRADSQNFIPRGLRFRADDADLLPDQSVQ